jgi:hypothetical protein
LVEHALDLLLVVFFDLLELLLVLDLHALYDGLIIGLAAVLQQEAVDMPDLGHHRILELAIIEQPMHHFEIADGVDEEGPVDPLRVWIGDARV